MHVIVHESIKE